MTGATKFAIAWLVLAAILALAIGSINLSTYFGLAKHGERTTATIVRSNCDIHSTAFYTFSVGSTRYSGSDRMTNCSFLQPGDSISIYYDTTDPTISAATEPLAGLVNDLIAIGLACLLAPPTMIGLFLHWYRKNRPRWSS
jgi:hypothetical protein